jgi:glycosyltransferase involved in cell wall biosynthesis
LTPRDRRLRVLTLVDGPPTQGGGERFAAEVAKRLDRERFAVTLCISRWPRPGLGAEAESSVREIADSGVRVLGLGRTSAFALWDWRPLYALLRREETDVIHSHKFGSNAWASMIGALARVPVLVAHEHSWSYEGDRLRRVVDRQLVGRRADAVIAVSSSDRRKMIEVEGIPAEKIHLMPCGIPSGDGAQPAELREGLGIGPDAPLIGAVGGLRPEKAFGLLLTAAKLLRGTYGDVHVVIAGDGPERQGLEEMIAAEGLEGAVHLLGYRDDVPAVVSALDVAVCCSEREGSPLSVLEFMRAARAIVATDVGGIPDLIRDGEDGILVPSGDPEALAMAIAKLLDDPGMAGQLGSSARLRQRQHFDLAGNITEIEGVYAALAGDSVSAA